MPNSRPLHTVRAMALGQAADQLHAAEVRLAETRANLDALIYDSIAVQGYQPTAVAREARVSRETVYKAAKRSNPV